MGAETVQAFDEEMVELLSKYSTAGKLQFEIVTRIIWGYPL